MKITVYKRENKGKRAARICRTNGMVPGILYPDIPMSLDMKDMKDVLPMLQRLVELDIDGKSHHAVMQHVDYHPVTNNPLHIDFMPVDLTKDVRVSVKIRFVNRKNAPGLSFGGVLSVITRRVPISVRADSIPEFLDIDLDSIAHKESVRLTRAIVPEGIELLCSKDVVVATVIVSKKDRSAAAAAS